VSLSKKKNFKNTLLLKDEHGKFKFNSLTHRQPMLSTSVFPFVTLVDFIQMAEGIVKLLSRPGSPITLVF